MTWREGMALSWRDPYDPLAVSKLDHEAEMAAVEAQFEGSPDPAWVRSVLQGERRVQG